MAVCEFHGKYADYLTDQIALKLVSRGSQDTQNFSKAWCIFNTISICKTLEQITSGEAENLTSIIFRLCPQFKVDMIAELGGGCPSTPLRTMDDLAI